MALTALGGLGLILFAIVASTIMDGNSFGPLISPSSFLLVFLCTLGSGVFAFEMKDVLGLPKALVSALRTADVDRGERISLYLRLAEAARREGLLALDGMIDEVDDAFVQYGLRLVTDGVDESQLRDELEAYMGAIDERHSVAPGILRKFAGYAPAFGMVGTVIGLVNMLGNLSSPSELGAGMALALLTTLYGSLFANMVFAPLADRLEKLHSRELSVMEFDTDAICALQSGTSPRALVAHLESLLPPRERLGYDERHQAAA